MTEITKHLYVASVEETFKDKYLKSNVTHFLNVANEVMINERVNHTYKKIGINDDDNEENICDIIKPCLEWMHSVINDNGIVCVHCLEGKSRSICVCIAYLCYYNEMSYEDAYELIKNKRSNIDIFPKYETQLKKWLEYYEH